MRGSSMMCDKNKSYLEEKLTVEISKEKNQVIFTFQSETVRLDQVIEINLLKTLDDSIERKIEMEQDELKLIYQLEKTSYYNDKLEQLTRKERSLVGHQLINKVKNHSLTRLHLVVSPENIVVSKGLSPSFLYYGVKESLPPYEKNQEELLLETKAMLAYLIDPTYEFKHYLKYYQTLKLPKLIKDIFAAVSLFELEEILERVINEENEQMLKVKQIPLKKWNSYRYGMWSAIIILIPVLIYLFIIIFINEPRQANITQAHAGYLNHSYSEVISLLQPYPIDQLPRIAQYELAYAYVMTEALTEEQRQNIRNTITLQSDPLYYEYWINIGRGGSEEALETARFIEDRDLILYSLIKQREFIRADQSLASEERQQKINEIEAEIKTYSSEIELTEDGMSLDAEQEMSEEGLN